jgi:ketosteroid isomerase-like protein
MSREDVELVLRATEAFARRDRATWLAINDADLEFVTPPGWPERDVRGAEAVWDFFLRFFDAFEPLATEPEVVHAGGDKVLLHYRFALSGRTSGAGVEFDYWGLLTIRQGKVRRAHWFADRTEALKAAGLSE